MPIPSWSEKGISKVYDKVLLDNAALLRRALRMLRDHGVSERSNEHVARICRELRTMEDELDRRGIEVRVTAEDGASTTYERHVQEA